MSTVLCMNNIMGGLSFLPVSETNQQRQSYIFIYNSRRQADTITKFLGITLENVSFQKQYR